MPRQKAAVSYEEFDSDIDIEGLDMDDKALDDIDTDELLESSEDEKPKKKVTKKKTTKKTPAKRKAPATKKATTTKTQTKLNLTKKVVKEHVWNKERVKELAEKYPDPYWKYHADSGHDMISAINEEFSLESIPCNMNDQAPITSMTLSEDGTLLATYSNIGAVKIWDIENDFALVRKLRDSNEKHIDEFYCGTFVEEKGLLAVGGKLKDRYRWSEEDQDNHILPCPIKIFDIAESKVLATLEGHSEEILCVKKVKFMGENYYISTSQDGYIMKWHMAEDWVTLLDHTKMVDEQTCMAFTVSFVPNSGNKYFIAATDEHLRLYDFEEARLLQTFNDLYSSYCDCGKFVKWLDESTYLNEQGNMEEDSQQYAWFISRGAEMCDVSEGVSSKPNTCTLHKLVYPTKPGDKFKLEQVKKYQNEDYHSNSWLVKITSNGRYLLAPTIYGQIFVFNMLSGNVTAILKDHQDMEVRDVIFHPYRPLIFSCGDDGFVKVYTYQALTANKTEEDVKSETDVKIETDLDVGMADVTIDESPEHA